MGDPKDALKLKQFELLAGIQTGESTPATLNLNHFCGVDIGIQNFKRERPLETEFINGRKMPTKAELCRIKAWLVITRNGAKEYADFVLFCDSSRLMRSSKRCQSSTIAIPNLKGRKSVFSVDPDVKRSKPYDL